MKLTKVVSLSLPWIDASNYFAQKVAKRSKGKIKVTLYDRGKLGNHSAALKALREGTIDLRIGRTVNAATYVSELSFFNLGCFFEGQAHFEKSWRRQFPYSMNQLRSSRGRTWGSRSFL